MVFQGFKFSETFRLKQSRAKIIDFDISFYFRDYFSPSPQYNVGKFWPDNIRTFVSFVQLCLWGEGGNDLVVSIIFARDCLYLDFLLSEPFAIIFFLSGFLVLHVNRGSWHWKKIIKYRIISGFFPMVDNHEYIFSLKQKISFKFKESVYNDNASFWPTYIKYWKNFNDFPIFSWIAAYDWHICSLHFEPIQAFYLCWYTELPIVNLH